MYDEAVRYMRRTPDQLGLMHGDEGSTQTEIAYRMAWARTYLKKAGYLSNTGRGIGTLTKKAHEQDAKPEEVLRHVRTQVAGRIGYDESAERLHGGELDGLAALRAESVRLIQKSRDGGIDGVLAFDDLGLRTAVFEVKRYAEDKPISQSREASSIPLLPQHRENERPTRCT